MVDGYLCIQSLQLLVSQHSLLWLAVATFLSSVDLAGTAFLQYWLLMHYCIEIGEKDEKVEQLLKEDDAKENSPQLELEDVSSKYKQI